MIISQKDELYQADYEGDGEEPQWDYLAAAKLLLQPDSDLSESDQEEDLIRHTASRGIKN